jgi:DNA-binding CsgD family transcriptional regulator
MSHSESIGIRDVVRVMRLIHETCEFGDDAFAWRKHFIEGLQRIVDRGLYGFGCVLRQPVCPTNVECAMHFWIGADKDQIEVWQRYTSGCDVSGDPVTPSIIALGANDFTRLREQLCTDKDWYRSSYFNEIRRPMRIDDMLYAQIIPPGLGYSTAFGLGRPLRSKPFTRRDVAIVHLAHLELRKIWRDGAGALCELGQRQSEVLELLCEGFSEKEVAHQLSLSPRTVHNYVTALHRKLNAHSRAELVKTGLRLLRRKGPRVLPNPIRNPAS